MKIPKTSVPVIVSLLFMIVALVSEARAAQLFTSGGALGTTLSPGDVDIDGDGTADITFVSFGPSSGFIDALSDFGLVGDSGGGYAWVSGASTAVAADGLGGNEIIAPFRGAILSSTDNWSKVHLSSGDGWVQWSFGSQRSIVSPIAFVLEGNGEDLSAFQAAAVPVPEPSTYGIFVGVLALGFVIGKHRFRRALT